MYKVPAKAIFSDRAYVKLDRRRIESAAKAGTRLANAWKDTAVEWPEAPPSQPFDQSDGGLRRLVDQRDDPDGRPTECPLDVVKMSIGLVLAVMLIAVAALILFPARGKPDEADEEDENARRQRLATEHDSGRQRLQTALDACRGLPARLTRIAEAAEARAAALRDAHDAGAHRRATPRESRLAAALGAAAREPTTPRHRLAAPGPSLRPAHRHTRRPRHRSAHVRVRV